MLDPPKNNPHLKKLLDVHKSLQTSQTVIFRCQPQKQRML